MKDAILFNVSMIEKDHTNMLISFQDTAREHTIVFMIKISADLAQMLSLEDQVILSNLGVLLGGLNWLILTIPITLDIMA